MKRILLLLCLAPLLWASGCGSDIPSSPPPVTLALTELERTGIHHETVWGHGWLLPAGEHILDLGAVPGEGAFRISLLEDGENPAPVRARVWAGDSIADDFESAGPEIWMFGSANLAGHAGQPCRVWLQCDSPFALGTCKITGGLPKSPNVLVFLIDTLRQDHVGCYGYERETSPHIDQLATEAVQFTQLMPPSSWTRPSVASLLTSAYPPTHGANDSLSVVRKNLPRLAEEMRDFGYETHGFVTNLNCVPLWNIGLEFDTHTDVDSENWQHADDAKLVDRFLEMLPALSGQPWFVYVHAMGPHAPYEPPGGFETRFQPGQYEGTPTEIARQKAVDLYDAEIAYTDAQFGRVLEALKRLGMYENTAIIVLADHGEEFWEHSGTDHGKTLYEEQLRVPLLWKLPHGATGGAQRDALVGMVDIAPTILEMVGASPEPRFQGKSFWAYLNGGDIEPAIGFASLELNEADMRASKTLNQKYIRDLAADSAVWYDLAADPEEQHALSEMPPWGEPLVQQASRMAQRGRSGLHILLTREPGSQRDLLCYVETPDFGAYDMVFPYQRGGGVHSEKGVAFSIHLRDIDDPDRARAWRETMGHDNAHIFVEIPKDKPVTLTLEMDGKPIGPEAVHVGTAMTPMVLDHVSLNPQSIAATWADMETAEKSEEFGVYVWYETGPGSLDREELDPEVRDALRGHGYLAD